VTGPNFAEALIGGTGSGKTSLVNLIPRFYDATVGEVIVDGINVKDYPLKKLRDKIGVVPQKENMRWGNKKYCPGRRNCGSKEGRA